ncbi:3-hydroxyisobutyrate dehydrogenase-like beta-hydroxyacid dehydrogenase (plasmid) [Ensifer sp. WSM1721]|uniref:NAD(P)-binding domain-containing protein n=1 Tax=Ensifer sp. WSM1721 TaxID=1041159 RepID=UPI00047C48F7|nr:NAD(P)-binding domain-containing protein [Ensifer sp. WSM1721]
MKQPVCVLGAGRMGSSVATTLLNNAYDTWIWNRTAAKCNPLIAMGAKSGARRSLAQNGAHADFASLAPLFRREGVASEVMGKANA